MRAEFVVLFVELFLLAFVRLVGDAFVSVGESLTYSRLGATWHR